MTMARARAAAAYGQAAQTIPPALQIVMLYDGAIARLREAARAIADGRTEDRFIAIQKASAIIDALHACIDYDRGGEIASLLDRLYAYFTRRLLQINVHNDGSICDEIIQRLTELRSSWQGIADKAAA
jgi:flagellar protein FliS